MKIRIDVHTDAQTLNTVLKMFKNHPFQYADTPPTSDRGERYRLSMYNVLLLDSAYNDKEQIKAYVFYAPRRESI